MGNTALITDANANPKASFQYDLHTGRLIQSWNPQNLELINLEDGIVGGINITASTAIGKDIILPPRQPPNIGGSTNGDNWGSVDISIEGARVKPGVVSDNFGKDCGDNYLSNSDCEWSYSDCIRSADAYWDQCTHTCNGIPPYLALAYVACIGTCGLIVSSWKLGCWVQYLRCKNKKE
jgi:hypothetical protein